LGGSVCLDHLEEEEISLLLHDDERMREST
jgi:hypothetical protein